MKFFTYLYDYGDSWKHRIKVEKALTPDPDRRWPLCLDGQKACPPEDVDGVPEYVDFLDAIGDPMRAEHNHFLEWYDDSCDPVAFDIMLANQRLSAVKF